MSETKSSNVDLKDANQLKAGSAWSRLLGLGVALVLALVFVVWIKSRITARVTELEQGFATIQSESFALGLHLREDVVRLNSMLLRYQLSGDVTERENFARLARVAGTRLSEGRAKLHTPEEQRMADEVGEAYQQYQAEVEELLDRSLRGVRRDSVGQVEVQIKAKSERLLALLDEFVEIQRAALGSFFSRTRLSLDSLQTLLWLSVGLLLLLLGLVTALMFRAFIAPLRVQLSQSQAVVERQEKLASLGVLAAGVAHEIRNPLTAIKFRLFSLKKALPVGLADNEDITIIHSEVNRLERIVRDFLQFARPSDPELTDVVVADLLQASQTLLREELARRGIQLLIEGCPDSRVRADRQQIRQVLINLIQNAAESMNGKAGVISLSARTGATRGRNGSETVVILEVADTGSGIPPEAQKRLFDPFFSTKDNGSGLGLPIAARIVEKHGGSIHFVTQPNRGTRFSVVLPLGTSDESANSPH